MAGIEDYLALGKETMNLIRRAQEGERLVDPAGMREPEFDSGPQFYSGAGEPQLYHDGRWLSLADVWDESADAHREVASNDYGPWPTNPYRKAATDGD